MFGLGKSKNKSVPFFQDILLVAKDFPLEKLQATAIAAQAVMGPLKLMLSITANAVLNAAYGPKLEELKDSAAIKLAALFIDETEENLIKDHEEGKAAYQEDKILHPFDGDGNVVAARFLIDAVVGELMSFGVKAGGRLLAVRGSGSGSGSGSRSGSYTVKTPTPDNRATNHILDGDNTGGGNRFGTGKPNKSELPQNWSDTKILNTIADIVKDPKVQWSAPDSRGYITGSAIRDGIDVKVVYDAVLNRVVSGYLTNVPRNPKK